MKFCLSLCQKFIILIFLFQISIHSVWAQDWNQVSKLISGDRTDKYTSGRSVDDEFGRSVGISGNYAVAGSPGSAEDSSGFHPVSNSGAIFVYQNIDGKWVKQKKITAGRRVFGAAFGASVAIDGDYIVVGAPLESDGEFYRSGAIYIFKRDEGGADNWGEVKRITAPVRAADYGNTFGYAVSISDGYVIVGSPGDDSQEVGGVQSSGSAYIFSKDQGGIGNWGFVKKLLSGNPTSYDNFGESVGISNGNAIVGAPLDGRDSNETNNILFAGSAYLFIKDFGGDNNWGQFKKLTANVRSKADSFGSRVAIDHDFVIIGATGDDLQETITSYSLGAAYIFEKNWGAFNNWGQVKKLMAPLRRTDDIFGRSVDINNNRAIVGARLATNMEYETPYDTTGMVYIYERNNGGSNQWGLEARRTAPNAKPWDIFGNSVALSENFAFVAAMHNEEDDDGKLTVKAAGAAYFFEKDRGAVNNWDFQQKITAATGARSTYGDRVAISGNFAIVSAFNDGRDEKGNLLPNSGAAYILYNDGAQWRQIKKLRAWDAGQNDQFGYSVAISGEYAVVSTIWHANGSGSVYIYKKDEGGANNWGLLKKLTANSPAKDDYFGVSVSIHGDNLVVGAFGEDEDGLEANPLSGAGAVYLFSKNQGGPDNWGLVKKITPTVRNAGDGFGFTVSISADYMIAGAVGQDYDTNESNQLDAAGAAYIFKKDPGQSNSWGQIKKITASNRTPGSQFGISVAINGDNALIGAPGGLALSTGAVYFYNKNSGGTDLWGEDKKISGLAKYTDPETGRQVAEFFGGSVALGDNIAVIGTGLKVSDPVTNVADFDAGYAYVYKKAGGAGGSWNMVQTLSAANGSTGDAFAKSVAISGKYILAGAAGDDEDALEDNAISNTGSVYFFLNSEPALPVTLASFYVNKIEKQSLLTWTTSFEMNSNYFEVQKSPDAHTWKSIGNISSGNESDELRTYTFTDLKPFSGENLYRLKMVDRDGTFAYSSIKGVSFDRSGEMFLYPNPVSEKLFIQSESTDIESIKITDSQGMIKCQLTTLPVDGIKLDFLPAGLYLIQVRKNDGSTVVQKVFVKK